MNENRKDPGWIDGALYNENRNKIPIEELQKYAGQWVAFSADGTRIIAGHQDPLTLASMLDQAGYKGTDVVYSQIWPDEVGLE
jgi:hypothetical protein